MQYKFLNAWIFIIVLRVPVSALTLDEAVHKLWANSPQIEAQALQVRLSAIDRQRRFIPNSPQLQYANTDDHTAETIGIAETFAFPGKAPAYFRFDKAQNEAAVRELQAKRYELARFAVQTYLDGAINYELALQQEKNIADMETLSRSLKSRYETGQISQPEWTVIELQLRQQKADLLALKDKIAEAQSKLNKALGITDDEKTWQLPEDLSPELLHALGTRTADEERAAAAEKITRAAKELSVWNSAPDITLGITRNRYLFLPGSPNGSDLTYSYFAGLTLPIFYPLHENTDRRRTQSQAIIDHANAVLQLQAAEADKLAAKNEYLRAKKRYSELKESDLPLAESLMESTFSAYKTSKLGIAELVLARKTLTDLRAQMVQLKAVMISAHLRCPDLPTEGVHP